MMIKVTTIIIIIIIIDTEVTSITTTTMLRIIILNLVLPQKSNPTPKPTTFWPLGEGETPVTLYLAVRALVKEFWVRDMYRLKTP